MSLTLQYLTPAAVAFIGQAAVAAASMPSMLSGYYCVAEMLTKNVYQPLFRPKVYRVSRNGEYQLVVNYNLKLFMLTSIFVVHCNKLSSKERKGKEQR